MTMTSETKFKIQMANSKWQMKNCRQFAIRSTRNGMPRNRLETQPTKPFGLPPSLDSPRRLRATLSPRGRKHAVR
jgi:hypothetical protein